MELDEIKRRSNEVARQFLQPSADGRGFICPVCGRGDGRSHHGGDRRGIRFEETEATATHKASLGYAKCFTCQTGGDIFDWYKYATGADTKEAMRVLGVDQKESKAPSRKQDTSPLQEKKITPQEIADYMGNAESYEPSKPWRGIDVGVLRGAGAKYLPHWRLPDKPTMWEHEVVAIPTSKGSYFVREFNDKGRWDMGTKQPSGLDNLQGKRDIYLVEGVIDALSLESVGVPAIGLSGTDGIGKLCNVLQGNLFPYRFLLAPDNDKDGLKAMDTWEDKLKAIGQDCKRVDVVELYGGAKDANEALQADRDGLARRVQREDPEENPWGGRTLSLIQGVEDGSFIPIPTGVKEIDKLLGGGFLPATLVTLGAPPAGAKTSITQWLMETMAKNKEDFSCLYFCGEMSREQLQARSISRVLYERGKDLTAMDILRGAPGWRDGVSLYDYEYASRVAYYSESDLDVILDILKKGVRYNQKKGKPAPFCVIDYLQIVQTQGNDEADRIGRTMKAMKDFARKTNSVVIIITAQNRMSNTSKTVSMFSGRGSSSIEYGADLCLSLIDTDYLADPNFDGEPDRGKKSLVVTKGRFVGQDARQDFMFDGRHTNFEPVWGRTESKTVSARIDSLLDEPPAR